MKKTSGQPEAPEESFKTKGKRLLRHMVRSVWFWLLLLMLPALGLLWMARYISGFADGYCRSVYRARSLFWNNVTGVLPCSIGECLVILLPVVLLSYVTVVMVRLIRHKSRRLRRILLGVIRPAAVASLLFFLFVINCGINYYCTDFSALTGLQTQEVSAKELYETCVYLADEAAAARTQLEEDANGVMKLNEDTAWLNAAQAFGKLHEQYKFVPQGYRPPKGVLLSQGMSELHITGVFFPFTFEANVNTDVPDFTRPFTMCHEIAHVSGFMHEQDANFLAYLACINADDPALRYAGYMEGLMYLSGNLYTADRDLYQDFAQHLNSGMRRDLAAHSEYWKQFEKPVAKAAAKINDSYLKSNAQTSGVKSYGFVADLIVAHYKRDIRPQLDKTGGNSVT